MIPEQAEKWLHAALGLEGDATPFPWQRELLRRFLAGKMERSLDIPTGLGKTAVMAIWLVARACGAKVPRRLVYVVDRRAVVDQSTEVAEGLRRWVLSDPMVRVAVCGEASHLPISTLRGQFADNRAWLADPVAPAIVVGTVDMVGSRILFEGYRTSRKMRPFHAAMLACDSLVVLDEAHLVPPFERLIEAIAGGEERFGPRGAVERTVIPRLALLSLSATGAATPGATPFGLTGEDFDHPVVQRRLHAPKRLRGVELPGNEKLPVFLAEEAWRISKQSDGPVRVLVYTTSRDHALQAKAAVEKLGASPDDTDLFVGGRRIFERAAAAQRLAELGFLAGKGTGRERSSFLFATSAGEVGVDLDADHMVSDLVAWERMVQRLGRVNRRGNGCAEVVVVTSPSDAVTKALKKDKQTDDDVALIAAYDAQRAMLDHLPALDGDLRDASPLAFHELKARAAKNEALRRALEAATTPTPLRPALTRAVVDAWSMTSLREHTGRPAIAPWLRGWVDEERPQTSVVWRTHLPVSANGEPARTVIEGYFEAAPPHASEVLETETHRVAEWLRDRAERLTRKACSPSAEGKPPDLAGDNVAAVVLASDGTFEQVIRLADLVAIDKGELERFQRNLSGRSLIVDARIGGLHDGLLSDDAEEPPATLDGGPWLDGSLHAGERPSVPYRVRIATDDVAATDRWWRERHRVAIERSEEGEVLRWLVVEKWRDDAATEEDRSAGRPQTLAEHQAWTEERANDLATRLGLPEDLTRTLTIAARLHDEGKRARSWQRAFKAPAGDVYAKTRGPVNTALLGGYRHEFGSLPHAERDPALGRLPPELRDLALHLIAAHHGFARPIIPTSGCEDAPPSALEERARDVALRYARLQRKWGPWGLAWWEMLLRAADQQASRKNDEQDALGGGE